MVGTRGLDPAVTGCARKFRSRFFDGTSGAKTRAATATFHGHHPASASGTKAVARRAIQGSPAGSCPAIGVASETATPSRHIAGTGSTRCPGSEESEACTCRSAKSAPTCLPCCIRTQPGPASAAAQISLHTAEAANSARPSTITGSPAAGSSQTIACSAASKSGGSRIAPGYTATSSTSSTTTSAQAGGDAGSAAAFAVDTPTAATCASKAGAGGSRSAHGS